VLYIRCNRWEDADVAGNAVGKHENISSVCETKDEKWEDREAEMDNRNAEQSEAGEAG
jgi:hypothetical protein